MDDLEQRLRSALEAHPPRDAEVPDATPAAVLVPVYPGPEPTLILTVRTEDLSSHKGQIAFPGGKIDPSDGSRAAAALREAHEEIGLDPSAVTVVGSLDTFPTFVSGYLVTPVVGYLAARPELAPNPAEVAQVLHVPIADLADEIRREPGFTHAGRSYPTEAWVWRDHVIWGVTARLLRRFLTVVASVGLATEPGDTESWSSWPIPSQR